MSVATAASKLRRDTVAGQRRFSAYPSYRPSGVVSIGGIPPHWVVRKVAHAFRTIGSGTTPASQSDEYYGGNVPWVTTTELREATIADTTIKLTPEALKDHSVLRLYPPGTLLFAMYGATIGRLGILGIPAAVNQACCALADSPHIDTRFAYYWFQMRRPVLIAWATGGGQPNLSQDDLREVRIPTPPLDEQRAIVAFLDRETARVGALIAKKQRLIELLGEKRAAVIDHSVTRGLDPDVPTKPTRFEWLGDAPSHWKVRAFRYSARIPNGQVDPEAGEFRDLPLIAPNHIESGTGRLLSFETAAEQAAESGKYAFAGGSVLYSKIRPGLAKVCIAPERGLCSADMYPVTPRSDIRPKFLMYYMLSRTFTAAVVLMSDRVAMPKINRRDLGAFPILVPPLSEQDAIIERIERTAAAIDRLADREQSAIETLREYRSALISAAVTGKIDVRGQAEIVTEDTDR